MAKRAVLTLLHRKCLYAFVGRDARRHLLYKMAMHQQNETESRIAYVGRKLTPLGSAVGFAKGAWETGKTIYSIGRGVAPFAARALML